MTHSHLFLHVLVRWLDFIALVAFLGGLGYRYFVLRPVCRARSVSHSGPSERIWMATMLTVLAATSLTDLLFRTAMMSGRPVPELFSVLPTVIINTHFGGVWVWRFGLILLLCGIIFLEGRRGLSSTVLRYLSLGAGVLLGLTTSLSGHAADQGNWSWTVLGDWIHVTAISGWVGGLFALQIHLARFLPRIPSGERRTFLTAAIRAFSTVAMTCVGGLFLSGVYNTWVHVHSPSLLVGTEYGKILILKWVLLGPMIFIGGVSRFYILPRLEKKEGVTSSSFPVRWIRLIVEAVWKRPDDSKLEGLFFRLITIEAVLGLAVLGCSAWITQLPPPHETSLGLERGHGQHAM
ncbi:MAG: CopD family protein [Nitrospirota bacterium]